MAATKVCTKCSKRKRTSAFSRDSKRKDGLQVWCKACMKAYGVNHDPVKRAASQKRYYDKNRDARIERRKEWGEENRERLAQWQKDATQRLKAEVHAAYGNVCACCGETEPLFLTIEHIGGVPDSHRESSGKRKTGYPLYLQIKKEGYPDYIELLCWNCNAARGLYGECPHESKRLRVVK